MKKTIAKLMAAAMLLSAVPAVSMPSFVSKAATVDTVTNTATSTAAQNFAQDISRGATYEGEILTFYLKDGKSLSDYSFKAVQGGISNLVAISATQDSTNAKLIHVKAALKTSMTSSEKSSFVSAVKNNTNTFKLKVAMSDNAGAATSADADDTVKNENDNYKAVFNNYQIMTSKTVYYIGGVYDNGKIRSGIEDAEALLQDRNVYAVISKTTSSDGVAEVELLKQDKNEVNKIKNNDNLRGKTLDITEVKIGGVTYKVGKIGSQAFKEAHMKKVIAKNVSKVGKGAFRKCKQLKNVNIKDKNKVRKIHAKAFYDCKNLRNVTIDARKLNTVGKDAFGKVKKNCKIKLKASKSKYNDVVKKIKKSGAKNVKYSRLAP